MKLNTLFAASVMSLAATLSFAQTAPAVAPIAPAVVQPAAPVDNTAKAEAPAKKHGKKQAHKVSVKKHKVAKHKKKAAM
jgi:Skp family chaperone for outer membrane proteins